MHEIIKEIVQITILICALIFFCIMQYKNKDIKYKVIWSTITNKINLL